jgi:hypothetical protein
MTFLSPEKMDLYDQLLDEAAVAVDENPKLQYRIKKLRLALEFVYFEQSKFYGKDQHGMFFINDKGLKEVKKGLNERVRNFAENCKEFGIYELSEGGLSPEQYYQEWLKIGSKTIHHLGENLKVNFITPPTEDFKGKGSYGLVDGVIGHKDYNINWIGWYGSNPEIELITNKLEFNRIKINFLDNQRHWIFPPEKIEVYGFKNKKWQIITYKNLDNLTENYTTEMTELELFNEKFCKFDKLKVVIHNQENLPIWQKRKNKKPMVMIDEIQLYNN